MTETHQLLHLTDADIATLELDARKVRRVIHDAFLSYSAGRIHTKPKTSIFMGPGHAFQSLAAVDAESGYAALKWVGIVPPGGTATVNINASTLLSDTASGRLRCLMDGRRATALRTAGMTAVAAQFLARQDSATIGFIGAGVQAEAHFIALTDLLPSLKTVYINSGTSPAGTRFAERCRKLGFEATATGIRETIEQSDIVITTVPLRPNFEPFIDAAWIRPGAFVAAVDLGRSWKDSGLDALDVTVVDEEAMKHYAKPGNLVPPLKHAHATLADLVGKRHVGRTSPRQRIMLFSSGSAVADLAIAVLIYERAQAQGLGARLAN
ncbi:MAG: ornithine cyclodeaminase family protein [Pusillimonas sp.]